MGQSPTFLAPSTVALALLFAVLRAEVPVALALLFGRAACDLAVEVVLLAALFALVAVVRDAFDAWVLVVFALAVAVLADLAAAWLDSCLRIRSTRVSPRLTSSSYRSWS